MKSYRPEELFDEHGKLIGELAELAPRGDRRMGSNPHANGGYPAIIAKQKGYNEILQLLLNHRMSLNFDVPSPNSIKKPKGPKEY